MPPSASARGGRCAVTRPERPHKDAGPARAQVLGALAGAGPPGGQDCGTRARGRGRRPERRTPAPASGPSSRTQAPGRSRPTRPARPSAGHVCVLSEGTSPRGPALGGTARSRTRAAQERPGVRGQLRPRPTSQRRRIPRPLTTPTPATPGGGDPGRAAGPSGRAHSPFATAGARGAAPSPGRARRPRRPAAARRR